MHLYTSPISPAGKRASICAIETGAPVDVKLINFQKGEQLAPEYVARNPMGKVPTLTDGDFTLWESPAILCYLAQKGDSALWPRELQPQTDMLRWMFFCASHIDPYFTTFVVERFIKARMGQPEDSALIADAQRSLARFVPVLEAQLGKTQYVTGSFGLADIALGCTLELAPLVRFDLSAYPNVRAWLARLQQRDSWRKCSAPPAG
jgi:glutathione S-transferase